MPSCRSPPAAKTHTTRNAAHAAALNRTAQLLPRSTRASALPAKVRPPAPLAARAHERSCRWAAPLLLPRRRSPFGGGNSHSRSLRLLHTHAGASLDAGHALHTRALPPTRARLTTQNAERRRRNRAAALVRRNDCGIESQRLVIADVSPSGGDSGVGVAPSLHARRREGGAAAAAMHADWLPLLLLHSPSCRCGTS